MKSVAISAKDLKQLRQLKAKYNVTKDHKMIEYLLDFVNGKSLIPPELQVSTDKKPEIKVIAVKARDFSRYRLKNGKTIVLKNVKRDKYYRRVAEVWIDGERLGAELIKAGLAKSYDGGKKEKW